MPRRSSFLTSTTTVLPLVGITTKPLLPDPPPTATKIDTITKIIIIIDHLTTVLIITRETRVTTITSRRAIGIPLTIAILDIIRAIVTMTDLFLVAVLALNVPTSIPNVISVLAIAMQIIREALDHVEVKMIASLEAVMSIRQRKITVDLSPIKAVVVNSPPPESWLLLIFMVNSMSCTFKSVKFIKC